MARAPFKLKSGNTPLFKQVGSSPAKQKHFLEKKKTIPMETHEGGDPNYKPKLKPKLKSEPKLKPLVQNKKVDIVKPQEKGKEKKTNITKGDVLQTIIVPQVDLKKTVEVGKHYTNKAIKKGKELYNKTKDYLNSEI